MDQKTLLKKIRLYVLVVLIVTLLTVACDNSATSDESPSVQTIPQQSQSQPNNYTNNRYADDDNEPTEIPEFVDENMSDDDVIAINLPSLVQTQNRQPMLVLLVGFDDEMFCHSYLTPELPTTTAYWSHRFFGETGETVNTFFERVSGDFNLQFTKPPFTQQDGFSIENPIPGVTSVLIQDGVAKVYLARNHPPLGEWDETVQLAFRAVAPFIDFYTIAQDNNIIFSENLNIYMILAGDRYDGGRALTNGMVIDNHWKNISLILSPDRPPHVASWAVQNERFAYGYGSSTGLLLIIEHEIGHLLGLPDLPNAGVHNTLMAGTGGGRVDLDPWSRIMLGFAEPQIILVEPGMDEQIIVFDRNNSGVGDVIKVISNVNPYQYFLIEYQPFNEGREIGHEGILIWHIDEEVIMTWDGGNGGGLPTFMRGEGIPHPNNNHFHPGVAVLDISRSDFEAGIYRNPFLNVDTQNVLDPTTTPNSNFFESGHNNQHRNIDHVYCHPRNVPTGIKIEILDRDDYTIQVRISFAE